MKNDAKKPQTRPADPELKNEGEGSRTGARSYDAGAEKMAKSGKVNELAKKAQKALEGPEGAELKRAEQDARKPRAAHK